MKPLISISKKISFNHRNGGMSLVELMVAVAVFLIGMIGYIAIMHYSMKSSRQALFNTSASDYAHNIMEFIRSNPQGDYRFDENSGTSLPIQDCANPSIVCSDDNLVSYQLYKASCKIHERYRRDDIPCEHVSTSGLAVNAGGLPNGSLSITRAPAGSQFRYSVTLQWNDAIAEWDSESKRWRDSQQEAPQQTFSITSVVGEL